MRGGAAALAWQLVALAAGIAAWSIGLAGWVLPAAFVPGAVKTGVGIARPEAKPPIKRIGYLETAVSTLFAVLAGIGLGASA